MFKGDFYKRKSEIRRRIHEYFLKKSMDEDVPSWPLFKNKLVDDLGCGEKWINQKLDSLGLKQENDEVVRK